MRANHLKTVYMGSLKLNLFQSWRIRCAYKLVVKLEKFSRFMEPENLSPYSQELATGPYPGPDELSPHRPKLSL
jgi:hypothetical protein